MSVMFPDDGDTAEDKMTKALKLAVIGFVVVVIVIVLFLRSRF